MKILAFETSCDETSCAVIEDGRKILSNVISTQVPIHKKIWRRCARDCIPAPY